MPFDSSNAVSRAFSACSEERSSRSFMAPGVSLPAFRHEAVASLEEGRVRRMRPR